METLDVEGRTRADGKGSARRLDSRRAIVGIATLVLASVAPFVFAIVGGTPMWLLLSSGGIATVAAGQHLRWGTALTAVMLGFLMVLAVLMQVLPVVGVSVELATCVTLLCVGLGSSAHLFRRRRTLRRWSGSDGAFAASLLAVPLMGVAATVLIELHTGGARVAWIMNKDSPANLMLARTVLIDHGVVPGGNPAPLTAELLAFFMAPGRAAVDTSALLSHDIHRVLQALILLIASMSVIGALVGAAVVPARRPVARAVLAMGLAGIPWTWFVMGYATQYGFFNALIAGPVLVCIWSAWADAKDNPVLGSALQAAGALVLLATWAPLVLIPLGLGLSVLVRSWRPHFRLRGPHLVAWSVPIVAFVVYGFVVTRPTIPSAAAPSSPGAAPQQPASLLALDGWFFYLPWATPVVVFAIVTVIVVTVTSTGHGSGWDLWGLLVILATGGVSIAYLVHERAGSGSPVGAWGYYPQKFSWLLCMLAPYIVSRVLARQLGTVQPMSRSLGMVVSVALACAVIMVQIAPADDRPVSSQNQTPRLAPYWTLASAFPLYSLTQPHGLSEFDPAAKRLLANSDPKTKVVFSGLLLDQTRDSYANLWLLQQPVVYGNPGPRNFAFIPDISDPTVLCNVVASWGGGVTVRTRVLSAQRKMRRTCGDADFQVKVDRKGPLPLAR